jgi:hypothetical protein
MVHLKWRVLAAIAAEPVQAVDNISAMKSFFDSPKGN